jgi:hypothetical protein
MNSVEFAGFFTEFAAYTAYRAYSFGVFAQVARIAGDINAALGGDKSEKFFRADSHAFIASFAFLGIYPGQAFGGHFQSPERANFYA